MKAGFCVGIFVWGGSSGENTARDATVDGGGEGSKGSPLENFEF